ncbi:hypothetical protein OROGR_032483 [Orobanche gracilis]
MRLHDTPNKMRLTSAEVEYLRSRNWTNFIDQEVQDLMGHKRTGHVLVQPTEGRVVPCPKVKISLDPCRYDVSEFPNFQAYSFSLSPILKETVDFGIQIRSLPSGLDDCKFSRPVLPDPAENRILVHLKESRKLFAFYPYDNDGDSEGKWELITTGLAWEDVKAVADNIIYFYLESDDLVSAYDITKSKWLTCVWSSNAFLNILCFHTISPCPGNKGMMYLIDSGPARGEATVAIFLKFRIRHIDNSILELSPVSLQSFRIPSTVEVQDFLAL